MVVRTAVAAACGVRTEPHRVTHRGRLTSDSTARGPGTSGESTTSGNIRVGQGQPGRTVYSELVCATADATAARDDTSSLTKMCARWLSTVFSLTTRSLAICRFVMPAATSAAT